MKNNFVWTDLSTFDLDIAQKFYSNVFGWKYFQAEEGYYVATFSNREVSGLYATPEKFRQMNMPSFWMSGNPSKEIKTRFRNNKRSKQQEPSERRLW